MKLYIYRGRDYEQVTKDATHVIVDETVTAIKEKAFSACFKLVAVIMGDNVKRTEGCAFHSCFALRFIRLSKTLEHIGYKAFYSCYSLEALFLPSTVELIENCAFAWCASLRLLILPNDIESSNVGRGIIKDTAIEQIVINVGVTYEVHESNRRVNEWLIHHMDEEMPFHKLCYNSSITTKDINKHLIEHGYNSALAIELIHGMAPLHMLSMNPHVPPETVAALLNVNVEVAFHVDNQGKTPLDYARD